MTITAQQLVDAVRVLCYPGLVMLEEEIPRTEKHEEFRKRRYGELRETTSFAISDLIASTEMLASILGVSAEGIEAEVRDRSRRQEAESSTQQSI